MQSSDKLTEEIRREILLQYGSLRHFCLQNGFSLSTVSDMLQNGVGSSRYHTVFQICFALDLPMPAVTYGRRYRSAQEAAEKVSRLDSAGMQSVLSFIEGMNKM
ncbi:MAG: hypothetical protein VB023_02080 [Oscillibacter sp.]|nr:hypothetical protein [Oscillibacter sp.]